MSSTRYSPNSTWLVTSRLDATRHVRRVEPMHFGCVELVEEHGSTRSSRRARHVERVETCHDESSGLWAYLFVQSRCQCILFMGYRSDVTFCLRCPPADRLLLAARFLQFFFFHACFRNSYKAFKQRTLSLESFRHHHETFLFKSIHSVFPLQNCLLNAHLRPWRTCAV